MIQILELISHPTYGNDPQKSHFLLGQQSHPLLLFDSEYNKHPFGMPCHIKNSVLRYNPFNLCPLYTFNPLDRKMGLLK